MVDSRPPMNEKPRPQPTHERLIIRDTRNAGWSGGEPCIRGRVEADTCTPSYAGSKLQGPSSPKLASKGDRPNHRSIPPAHLPDSPVPSIPDSHRPTRFDRDADENAKGFSIASASVRQHGVTPRGWSAVRSFPFSFWATSGKGAASLPHPPLRTGREGFPSSGSSRFKALHHGRPANATV